MWEFANVGDPKWGKFMPNFIHLVEDEITSMKMIIYDKIKVNL